MSNFKICTALVAAPFLMLSLTVNKLMQFSRDSSRRTLPTKTSLRSFARLGIGYLFFAGSSRRIMPGALAKTFLIVAKQGFLSNSTLIEMLWEFSIGTRTVVAEIARSGRCRILRVSKIILSSSFVLPFSRNTSMCGMRLLKIWCWNFCGAAALPS